MKKKTTAKRLEELYKTFQEGDNVLIVINADPDSMGSALAFKRIMWRRVSSIAISNINILDRPDNIAMIRLLKIRMIHIDDITIENYNRFVILDSQPNHHERFSRFQFDVVIDHHPDARIENTFSDIRPLYGATASILTEYLMAARIKPSVRLATALFHAIKTDTCNFERKAIVEDMEAFQFLFKYVNIQLSQKIEQSEIRLNQLKYYERALEGKVIKKGRLFCHLGTVENPDICVNIADFFMKIESIQWSIVSGIYNDLLIIIFRNDGVRKNAGALASNRFGNISSAGGHKSAARAEIPLTVIQHEIKPYNSDNLLNWIIKKIR